MKKNDSILNDDAMEIFSGGKLRPDYQHRLDQLIIGMKGIKETPERGWSRIEKQWRDAQQTGRHSLFTNAFSDDLSEEDLAACREYYFAHFK